MNDFEAEFRGLFYGEGCIDLMPPSHGSSLMPRARIMLGCKDKAIIHAVRDHFGGSIHVRKADGAAAWQVSGRKSVERVLDVLEAGVLPTAKRREFALMRQALLLIPMSGHRIPPDDALALHEIKVQLSAAKRSR